MNGAIPGLRGRRCFGGYRWYLILRDLAAQIRVFVAQILQIPSQREDMTDACRVDALLGQFGYLRRAIQVGIRVATRIAFGAGRRDEAAFLQAAQLLLRKPGEVGGNRDGILRQITILR